MFVRKKFFFSKNFEDIIYLVFTSFKDESNIYLVLEFITGGKILHYYQTEEEEKKRIEF